MKDQVFVKTDKSGSKKRRVHITLIITFTILCIFGFFAYLYYWSPLFRVNEFLVRGVSDVEEVRSAIMDYATSQDSFFSPAHDRIVFWMSHDGEIKSPSFLPLASSINVTSNIEEKTVIADVTPRVMRGVWCVLNGCFVFDEDGILFAHAPDVSGSLILKIRDENNTPVSLGSSVLSSEEFRLMSHAVEHVKKNNIPVSEVVLQNKELKEWATVAPNGFSVRFSFNTIPEDLDSVFKGVFERTQLEKLTYIDLRVSNRVYFK
ncbi:hypothetical protein C4565_09130 [Candidatus Parcubacteria bacterium]|jgi:hypothetical protein|nr:MAG: hypothetical protein C4565_09130 [Candidatus Parcubacteria bacterium]